MAEHKRVSLESVLFEFVSVGNAVKVSAIDPISGVEVSIVGDPKAGRETLKKVAVRKLEYMLAKRPASSR